MKKLTVFIIALIMAITLTASPVLAKDMVKDFTITSITADTDKNGNEYTRVIANEPRELNGMKYTVGVPVMFFGTQHDAIQASGVKTGDTIKCIVPPKKKGFDSYTVNALINQ